VANEVGKERGLAMVKRLFVGVLVNLFLLGLGSAAMGADPLGDPNAVYENPSLDHYRCYKVKDLSDPKMASNDILNYFVRLEGVTLNDPGDPNSTVNVKKKMKWVCVPTKKTLENDPYISGKEVINPYEWLCGYQIKAVDPKKLPKPGPTFALTNQFQFPATVELKKSDFLLVPCADPNNPGTVVPQPLPIVP
jgi:hypothetical protein